MRKLFRPIIAAAAAFFAASAAASAPAADVERFAYEVVAEYPHDPEAFTQGLFFHDGKLYEGTGLVGQSTLREVELETGKVLRRIDLPPHVFGEGVAPWKDRIVTITWRNGEGYVFDRKGFRKLRAFAYPGEGWGLTSDGRRLIMSDGTSALRFLDPETLAETGRVEVTLRGKPLKNLNELEYVDGAVFANVWQTSAVVRIDPKTGTVTGVVDLRGLRDRIGDAPGADVLNGIAWDAKKKRLFLTGKKWPKLFEVRLVPKPAGE
ncbi:MAG: glutaminyl-peptide cyclotransferase [Parvularculaceae bacterium]|nr:glutaminyl-peptide cyclotransferase [Parvularculaceae bacterium]